MTLALTYRNTLVLATAGLAAFGASNTSRPRAQSSATPTSSPAFEVASVKRTKTTGMTFALAYPGGRFTAVNLTLRGLILASVAPAVFWNRLCRLAFERTGGAI